MASEREPQEKADPNSGPYRAPPPPDADPHEDRGAYYYQPPETLLQRPTPRRSKRHVPDGEKDNKYWEKRKRNNDAARRSRENKRRMDVDVRQRVLILEEEMSLMRKELTVIKIKYRLPLDQRFLSTDDRGDLVPTPITSPMTSPIGSSGMTSDGMSNGDSYSMPSAASVPSENSALLPPLRPGVTSPRHQGAPHIITQLPPHLGPPSQTSPSDNMPVKKRKRGRREWEDTGDESPELAESGSNSNDAYYGRMMSASPYPGLLWPSTAAAAQAQLPFPGQIPMMGPAAYQALMDEQQRLPSINAFSNVPVKLEEHQQQRQQQQQQQSSQQHQSQQQQQQQTQQQEQSQQQHQQQQHQSQRNSGPVEPTPGNENFNYLGSHPNHAGLPRYYMPYSDTEDSPSHNGNLTPADLSLTKSRHQTLDLAGSEVSDHPPRSTHHQQIGVVQPMQGNHHHQQQQQQHQQQQQQQHQQQHHQTLSSASDEDEQQDGLMVNSDIRSRLQQLSAEVAKMKNYVLKDNIRTPGQTEEQ